MSKEKKYFIKAFIEGALVPAFVVFIMYLAHYIKSIEWVFVSGLLCGMYSRGFIGALVHDAFKLYDNIKGWREN